MISKSNNTNFLFLNIAFFLIPISFILGSSFINLNIVIIILYGLLMFKLDIFKIKLTKIDKLILIFFIYVIINGTINNFYNFNFSDVSDHNLVIKKSFLYLRFLLLYFIIRFLVIKNFLNYKYLLFSFGLCSLFVSIDIIIQFLLGVDIFGYESTDRRLSGPFGDEKIAGSFIQRFFIFLPFSILLFSKINNKNYLNFIFFIIFIISIVGTFLSGNRVPFILLIISLPILFLIEKTFRKNFAVFFVLITGFVFLIAEQNIQSSLQKICSKKHLVAKYLTNRIKTGKIVGVDERCKEFQISEQNKQLRKECSKYLNVYIKEIESGILTWEENKYFGGGIKSFRWNCNNIDRSKMLYFVTKRGPVNCNNHPHNYYLQIAAELGLFGLIMAVLILASIFLKGILYFKTLKKNEYNIKIFVPFFLVFVLEIFPFKTTGSFFTTTNATFLFIIMSFVVGLMHKKEII